MEKTLACDSVGDDTMYCIGDNIDRFRKELDVVRITDATDLVFDVVSFEKCAMYRHVTDGY